MSHRALDSLAGTLRGVRPEQVSVCAWVERVHHPRNGPRPGGVGCNGLVFYFVFSGCGVRVSECASPGGHCRSLCTAGTRTGARVSLVPVSRTRGWLVAPVPRCTCASACAAAMQIPLIPKPGVHPNLPPCPLPATSRGPVQPLPCSALAGMGWVLSDVSLVTRGDPRNQELHRSPPSPGSA